MFGLTLPEEFGGMGLEGYVRLGYRKELEAVPAGAYRLVVWHPALSASALPAPRGTVTFEQVSFAYPARKETKVLWIPARMVALAKPPEYKVTK